MTNHTGVATKLAALELNAIGNAIFADWFPKHRTGYPIPPNPPRHIMRKSQKLAWKHRLVEARRRGVQASL